MVGIFCLLMYIFCSCLSDTDSGIGLSGRWTRCDLRRWLHDPPLPPLTNRPIPVLLHLPRLLNLDFKLDVGGGGKMEGGSGRRA